MNFIGNNINIKAYWNTASGNTLNYTVNHPDLSHVLADGTTGNTVLYSGKINQISGETATNNIRLNDLYKTALGNPKLSVFSEFNYPGTSYFYNHADANNAFLYFRISTVGGGGYISTGDGTNDFNNIMNWYNRPCDTTINPEAVGNFVNMAQYAGGALSNTPITLPIINGKNNINLQTQLFVHHQAGNTPTKYYPVGRVYYNDGSFGITMAITSNWAVYALPGAGNNYCCTLTTSLAQIQSGNTLNKEITKFVVSFVTSPSPYAWNTQTEVPIFYAAPKPCKYKYVLKFVGRNSGVYYLGMDGKGVYSESIQSTNKNSIYGEKQRYLATVTPTFEVATGWLTDGNEKINLVENLITSNDITLFDIKNNAEYHVTPATNNWVCKEYDNEKKAIFYSLNFTADAEKKY